MKGHANRLAERKASGKKQSKYQSGQHESDLCEEKKWREKEGE